MEYYGPKKLIALDETLIALFDRGYDLGILQQDGVSCVRMNDSFFMLFADNLVIPVTEVIRYKKGVSLIIAGGDTNLLYPEVQHSINLDERAVMKLELMIEMSESSGNGN